MNHLLDRPRVLRDWLRVLKPGRRALFTDPVVVMGPVTSAELQERASIGSFLFVPPGVNERMIVASGLALVWHEDVSEECARVADRWRAARDRHRAALVELEGEERFAGLQRFLGAVHKLTSEHRLSRIAYLVEKPA